MLSVREWCASVAGGRSVRAYGGHTQDMFDGAPFSNSKAFSATSQRTFHGHQAMIYVQVLCTPLWASTSGRAELLPAQLAIRVDYRYIELARCGHKANLDIMQENYVPGSPLFLHLAA